MAKSELLNFVYYGNEGASLSNMDADWYKPSFGSYWIVQLKHTSSIHIFQWKIRTLVLMQDFSFIKLPTQDIT